MTTVGRATWILSLAVLAGCGDSRMPTMSGETGCAEQIASFDPCGGDITGRWQLEAFCATGPAPVEEPPEPECRGLFQNTSSTVSAGAWVIYREDLVYLLGANLVHEGRARLTAECFAALGGGVLDETTCDEFESELTSQPEIRGAICEHTGGVCECEVIADEIIRDDDGSSMYSAAGGRITYPLEGFHLGAEYCIAADGSMTQVQRDTEPRTFFRFRRSP